jgi:hypothetical protein
MLEMENIIDMIILIYLTIHLWYFKSVFVFQFDMSSCLEKTYRIRKNANVMTLCKLCNLV